MAQENVMLNNVKKILEMMCESDEEKAFSREDFNQNRNLYKKIKEHLKEIMECKIKNSAELEDFQYLLKNNINKYKQEIFSIAQQMYYHMQELNSEVNLRYAELTKNEELLQKNEKVFEEKVNKLKLIETKFKKQLEFKEKEEAEDTRKKDLEIRTMSLENEEIKAEIKILDQQIEYYEHYFKSDSAVLDDEINYEMVIENLQKSITSKENEIQELSKLSEEAKQFRKALQNEEHARILELDNQINNAEIEINTKRLLINDCQLNIDELSKKIKIVKDSIKGKEEECSNNKNEVNNIKMDLKDVEYCNKSINFIEKFITESKEKYKQEEMIREQIKSDISILENKMENQRDQMEKILQFLIEKKDTHINLDAALQMRKEVKETLHQLEEHYNKQLVEIEAKLNRGQEEMETREQANNKLQENTDALILELNQLKTDLEQDKAGLNGDMEKLNNQIEMINIELTQVRADKLKNKGKSADMNIQTSQTGSAKEKKINVRHWDSDSSVEGEDKRLLDLIQQKMRIKKPRKIINLK